MQVVRTTKAVADLFVKEKHYARRQGFFRFAFALVEDGFVTGVAVFGEPPLQVVRGAFRDRDFPLYELVRVVVQTESPNAASFLVGGALRLLSAEKCACISYADSGWGHCGIIYQATNWIFTGSTVSHDSMYVIDGQRVHPRTLAARGITSPKEWAKANGIETVAPSPKHRYVYLCGTKADKKDMRKKLAYPVGAPYPKSESSRYDDGDLILLTVEKAATL